MFFSNLAKLTTPPKVQLCHNTIHVESTTGKKKLPGQRSEIQCKQKTDKTIKLIFFSKICVRKRDSQNR